MTSSSTLDYTRICFVIMPFGLKPVGRRKVDFDFIYDNVFKPAVERVRLPEGGTLEPRRTDKDFFTGSITHEMFAYLEYSRFALADISGLNANVFYELGVRHRTRESGTAVFRQTGSAIPFDINNIKAFDYDYEPIEKAQESQALVTQVLEESLVHNRLDSPVQIALRAQRSAPPELDTILQQAENEIRRQNWQAAIHRYNDALALQPSNPLLHQKLGLFFKDLGEWPQALQHFDAATSNLPSYSDAWREKGIAENKQHAADNSLPSGEAALRRAIELEPSDFDARASLGGVLKRQRRYDEALVEYRTATHVSRGNAYPLLNELKLEGHVSGKVDITPQRDVQLRRAEQARRAQTEEVPPIDAPWCFFDLSEIRLYREDATQALEYVDRGIDVSTAAWQPGTHRASLELLAGGGVQLPGLTDCIERLRAAERALAY